MREYGIVIVSHSADVARGVVGLLMAVAKDVAITYVGGTEDGRLGTTFEQITAIINENPQDKLFAFFDLGSAKMNLELAVEMSAKEVEVLSVPIVEGAYAAAALLQANADMELVRDEMRAMALKK
jgi:dihydroxyacetone kinase phosphotransfer subunit